jgi:ferredoxin-thioredoxin reductase catalytic subunit
MKSLISLKLNNEQIYFILKRFYTKYIYKGNQNPNKLPSNQEDIHFIKAYICPCIYTNKENKKRENLFIKFRYKQDTISLNILLEDYKDLLEDYKDLILI